MKKQVMIKCCDILFVCFRFSFCQYPFILSIAAKRSILQKDSEQQMIVMARVSIPCVRLSLTIIMPTQCQVFTSYLSFSILHKTEILGFLFF